MPRTPPTPDPNPRSLTVVGMELNRVPTPDLRAELARGVTFIAERLLSLSMVWLELERRGENLDEFRRGMNKFLPLIATGRLAAEAVLAFAGRPSLLHALEGVPLERQRSLASGKSVQVIDPGDPTAVQEMPLSRLPHAAVRLVFTEGEERSPEQQRLALRPRRSQREHGASRRYRPRYDPAAGTITVGRMTLRLADLLSELAAAAGPDRPPASDRPDDYLTVKVRLNREEHDRFQALCRRHELPDWEMVRKALRAFGLI